MMDPAAHETDKIIAEMEARVRAEYARAAQELRAKVADYGRRFNIKNQTWLKWLHDGKVTQERYKEWLIGQLAVGERWEDMRNTLATDLTNTGGIARSIINGYMPDVYLLNHAYATYEVETELNVNTSYVIYSRESVEFLFRENPQMLPGTGKTQPKKSSIAWENRQLQSVMIQAILQGESIPDIATRLEGLIGEVCEKDRKVAFRGARTMATGVQNAGRIDAYKRAEDLGVSIKKKWRATLDMRTRHEHRLLDGVSVPVNEAFVVEGEKIRYPGDVEAKPQLVYNCRCTLIADIKGWKSASVEGRSFERLENEGLTYEQWKASRVEKTNPILLPDEKRKAIRDQYIRGYRYGIPPKGRIST